MGQSRLHIVIPQDLAREIDRMVGKRGRSKFLTQAAEKELKRLRMLHALQRAAGSWKDKDHPELRHGVARWVAKLRKLDERRISQASLR
jgi:hypothetical protein